MSSAGAGAAAVSFSQIDVIVGNNCAGCHVSRKPILTSTGTTLYNVLTSTVVKQCGNDKLITPGDTANSALVEMVTNQCNGFFMPTSCSSAPCLVPDELTALNTWISQGAKGP